MCLSPVPLTRSFNGRKQTVYVPCGKCPQCKKQKQSDFVVRAFEEYENSKNGLWFVTLTYSPENVKYSFNDCELIEEDLPNEFLSLCRNDISLWKKRVKRYFEYRGQETNFSYCFCGEYGPQTHRPHYHGIIFNCPKEVQLQLKKDWETNCGFSCWKYVPKSDKKSLENVTRYVAKYIIKYDSFEDSYVQNNLVEKPRRLTSIGFGTPSKERFDKLKSFFCASDILTVDNFDDLSNISFKELQSLINEIIKRRKSYHINGKEYKLPDYLKRKFFNVESPLKNEKNQTVFKSSTLQNLVSKALQCNVQKDFASQCRELADRNGFSENYEDMVKTTEILCNSLEIQRKDLSESLQKNYLSYIKKSKF